MELAVLLDIYAADMDSRQFAGSVQVCGEQIKRHAHPAMALTRNPDSPA